MSSDFTRPRSNSSVDRNVQKVLNLDSSPGSSRKISDDGESEKVHIPNFSEEVLSDFEDETIKPAVKSAGNIEESQSSSHLTKPVVLKSILKRRIPNQQRHNVTEIQRNTKCCHPLVNKIRHIADKTFQKLERNETEKISLPNDQKTGIFQEIKQLKCSPGASRRQKFGTIKLGDSDEMSKLSCPEVTPPVRNKNHIYEDIEDKIVNPEEIQDDIFIIQKSYASNDPSLVDSFEPEDDTVSKLHSENNDDMGEQEAIFDDIIRNRTDHNLTTAGVHGDSDPNNDESNDFIEMSPSLSPQEMDTQLNEVEFKNSQWSKSSSDHEYEIIEKISPITDYNHTSASQISTDDELFFSNEKYLSQTSNEVKSIDNEANLNSDIGEGVLNIEYIQEDPKDRYIIPIGVTETKFEISADQVDSTTSKNVSSKSDNTVQHHFKEGTRKLKTQANKLKTKLDNLKAKQFNMPEKGKIKFPERPLFTFPQRPKLNIPYRSKKDNKPENVNIGHKHNLKKKSTYSIPNFSKFVVPGLPKTYFSKIYRKKDCNVKTNTCDLSSNESFDDGEFESNRDIKSSPKFSLTRPKKVKKNPSFTAIFPTQTQDYEGVFDKNGSKMEEDRHIDAGYDFGESNLDYRNECETLNFTKNVNESPIPLVEREISHTEEVNHDEFFFQSREMSRENIRVREYLNNEIQQAFKVPRNELLSIRSNAESDEQIEATENDPYQYSNDQVDVKDNRFYTFPPVRPSRTKNKTERHKTIKYIDDSVNTSKQVSDDNIDLTGYQDINEESIQYIDESVNNNKQFSEATIDFADQDMNPELIQYIEINSDFTGDQDIKGVIASDNQFSPSTDMHCVHEYANDIIVNQDNFTTQYQTQPIPPKRIKKHDTKVSSHSPNIDSKNLLSSDLWDPQEQIKDIIVYQTQYEYINPQDEIVTEQCIVPPRRHRSLSSRNISLSDEEQTSHATKPSIFNTHSLETGIFDADKEIRCDNSEYATVNKRPYMPVKSIRRSKSKTPSVRRSKSNSSERKYYTVDLSKVSAPSRPIRKKSSSSLTTFDDYKNRSDSTNLKPFVENNNAKFVEEQKGLNSCEIMSKMKDRPLPPPPRPPRGPKKMTKMKDIHNFEAEDKYCDTIAFDRCDFYSQQQIKDENVVEVEVSTQTDQLPENENFELVMNKSQDVPIHYGKDNCKVTESSRSSCPRSEHSFELPDYFNTERTSPNVILIERNISSPTRINERDEILTEASLIVQHIDINEQTSNILPFPKSDTVSSVFKNLMSSNEGQTLEIVTDAGKEITIDNLVTKRLRVKDLDVSHLRVSELQADKLQVSQTTDVDSSSARIAESGIQISQSIIDEVVRKFSEITSAQKIPSHISDSEGTQNKEEQTQTEWSLLETDMKELLLKMNETDVSPSPLSPLDNGQNQVHFSMLPPRPENAHNPTPHIPIPPRLTPLLSSYFQDTSLPPASFYATRSLREAQLTDFNDPHQSAPSTSRRERRQSPSPPSESSSDEDRPHVSSKAPILRAHDLTITEAGAQFMSVCQKSISRIFKSIFNYCISYVNATDDKKDMQMAFVIFLVLIAGLVMFGLSDLRTIHHHHWEFFNPPDGTQRPF